ncbi:MAG: CBS domain-containing protein [Phycisphaerae bacterium]|jgi:CBS domain-containing protein
MSGKQTILLVDDDVDFVKSTTDFLEAHGYTVLSAHDGEAGFELARKKRPDLMILDVMMATKTEGFEVARKIPECPDLRTMPVLLVTGVRREMQLGFRLEPDETWLPVSRVMEKPIDPGVFIATVEELLRRRGEMDLRFAQARTVRDMLAAKSSALWTAKPETTVFEAIDMMHTYRVSSLLVVESDHLRGICTDQDCARKVILEGLNAKTTLVRDVMTAHVITVSQDQSIEECMSLMTHKRIRHLPVVDGEKLVGIVSIGDVVRSVLTAKDFVISQLENYISSG